MNTDNKVPSVSKEESYAAAIEKLDGGAAAAIKTRDHEKIRQWAARHQAVPATGEATPSGPATAIHVTDGGTGLRFNFPGFARFREIGWDEWFAHFDQHKLVFIYEEEIADRATRFHRRVAVRPGTTGRTGSRRNGSWADRRRDRLAATGSPKRISLGPAQSRPPRVSDRRKFSGEPPHGCATQGCQGEHSGPAGGRGA
jgi:hypothetical protein